jgi:hypothetical protein
VETVPCHVVVETEASEGPGAAAELVVGDLEVAEATETVARTVIGQLDPHAVEPSGAYRPGQRLCIPPPVVALAPSAHHDDSPDPHTDRDHAA